MSRWVKMAAMPARRGSRRSWFVYLIECRDGTLYTGVAMDVVRRVAEHNAGRGARYTRGRAPVRMVAASRALDKRAAYRLEWALKRRRARDKAAALLAWRGPRASPRKARRAADE
jgi:putative endonuclease